MPPAGLRGAAPLAAVALLVLGAPLALAGEDCLWYLDRNGSWHPGFNCEFFTFCCGTCYQRYCCRDLSLLITERQQKHCLAFRWAPALPSPPPPRSAVSAHTLPGPEAGLELQGAGAPGGAGRRPSCGHRGLGPALPRPGPAQGGGRGLPRPSGALASGRTGRIPSPPLTSCVILGTTGPRWHEGGAQKGLSNLFCEEGALTEHAWGGGDQDTAPFESPKTIAGIASAVILFVAVVATTICCFLCSCCYLYRRRQQLQSPFEGQEIPMTGVPVQPVYPYPQDPKAGPAPPQPGFMYPPSGPAPQYPLYPAGPPVYNPAAPPPYMPPQPSYPGA